MKKLIYACAVLSSLAVATGCQAHDQSAPREDSAQLQADMWAYQESETRKCMGAAGFEYIERAATNTESLVFTASPYFPNRGEAHARGFGYVDDVVTSLNNASEQTADPNEALRASMNDAKRAYDARLRGDADGNNRGCRASSREHAFSPRHS